MTGEDVPAPLFVIGSPRSGTTLMRRILNSHPEIHISGETQFLLYREFDLDQIGASLAASAVTPFFDWLRPFLEAERWAQIPTADDLPASLPLTYPDLYRFVCRFEAPPEKTTLRYWGDNTPRYVAIVDVLRRFYGNSRFIHVVRDARDVVASVKPLHIGGNTALVAAIEWSDRVGRGVLAERVAGPETVLTLRYEDLVLETAKTLDELARFLDIPNQFNVNLVDDEAMRKAAAFSHHERLTRPLDPSSIGSYRSRLSPADIATVESITHDGLHAFGYPVGRYRPSPLFTSDYLRIGGHYLFSYVVRRARSFVRRRRSRSDPW